jgi:exoribonuclease-2
VNRREERGVLLQVARKAMLKNGLEPDFPPKALAEAEAVKEPQAPQATKAGAGEDVEDLRSMAWCSIDNDDSRDLDQLTVAQSLGNGDTKIMVAIADVSAAVAPGSAMDEHAIVNTTSVYTPPRNFPMLPERLSTDLTSLNPNEDRLAMVVDMRVDAAGAISATRVTRAWVRNQAKLGYPGVSAWLEGKGDLPAPAREVADLAENLRLQDQVAQRLKARRHEHGALELETIEVHATFDGDAVTGLAAEQRGRAKELIEDFMIAANGAIAGYLEAKRFPVVRRVVRSPERWPRIVDLARSLGAKLPATPDVAALHDFLLARRAADPEHFPDLSLAVIKLLGKGEYDVAAPGQPVTGHFGLAVREYTHSTAPNRRYPDLITQRLLKAALAGSPPPYRSSGSPSSRRAAAVRKMPRRKSSVSCASRRPPAFWPVVWARSSMVS